MTTNYLKKIKEILYDKFGIEPTEIEDESYFQDDLNIGEMELGELLTDLEEMFHTNLLEEKENIESVKDLLDLLSEKLD